MKYKEIFQGGMKHRVAVYIPGTIDATTTATAEAENMTREIAGRLSEMFGGATITEASGAWMSQEHGLITEQVRIVYSYCTEDALNTRAEAILKLAEQVRDVMRQEAVSVEIDNELYFI